MEQKKKKIRKINHTSSSFLQENVWEFSEPPNLRQKYSLPINADFFGILRIESSFSVLTFPKKKISIKLKN